MIHDIEHYVADNASVLAVATVAIVLVGLIAWTVIIVLAIRRRDREGL